MKLSFGLATCSCAGMEFYKVQEQLSAEIKMTQDELRADLRRMEEKLDTES